MNPIRVNPPSPNLKFLSFSTISEKHKIKIAITNFNNQDAFRRSPPSTNSKGKVSDLITTILEINLQRTKGTQKCETCWKRQKKIIWLDFIVIFK